MNIEELRLVIDLIRDLGEFSLWGMIVWVGVDLFKMIFVVGAIVGTICYVAKLILRLKTQDSFVTQIYTQVFGKPPTCGYLNSNDKDNLACRISLLKDKGE